MAGMLVKTVNGEKHRLGNTCFTCCPGSAEPAGSTVDQVSLKPTEIYLQSAGIKSTLLFVTNFKLIFCYKFYRFFNHTQ